MKKPFAFIMKFNDIRDTIPFDRTKDYHNAQSLILRRHYRLHEQQPRSFLMCPKGHSIAGVSKLYSVE